MAMQIDAAFNYNDLNGLESLKKGARDDNPEALKVVAQQFESMFISLIMKSMREATDVFASELESSYQTKFYRDMHDQQLSLSLSQDGGFGLAEVLHDQLTGQFSQDPTRSLEQLRSQPVPSQSLTQFGLDELKTFLEDSEKETTQTAEEMAPFEASSQGVALKFDSPVSFIKQLLPLAEKVASRIGLDPKIMLAQAALETGWGQKMISRADGETANNFFGIKSDARWDGESAQTLTHEYIDGTAIKIQDRFRAYESAEASFNDYIDFVSGSKRYQAAIDNAHDPAAYLKALQNGGYATDPNYADKITRIASSDWFKES